MSNAIWVPRMIGVAKEVASWSKDQDRKVGAVITSYDNHILSTGYNGYPSGLNDMDLSSKNLKSIHAEINALLRLRTPSPSMKMYISGGHPCAQCAAAICQSNVREVYCKELELGSKWLESMMLAVEMLEASGRHIYYVE